MLGARRLFKFVSFLVIAFLLFSPVWAQKKSDKKQASGKPVLWEKVNIKQQNLFYGPGGTQWLPKLNNISVIKVEEDTSTVKKYRIKDGAGRVWVAKINDVESQPETAAVRLVSALGYKTEITYLVPRMVIPGKGTFTNVRLEARPENVERLDRWKWNDNPFEKTNELQGLKIMMAFLNNWDTKDSNNVILQRGKELHYAVSDLGATFGKVGNSKTGPLNFLFWRIGRTKNQPLQFSQSEFVDEVEEDGKIDFRYSGQNRRLTKDITVNHGRWLANLLLQLSDKQIEDAFRAANYAPAEVRLLTQAVRNRIRELDSVTRPRRAGK